MKPDEPSTTVPELQEPFQPLTSIWMSWMTNCTKVAAAWFTMPVTWWSLHPYWLLPGGDFHKVQDAGGQATRLPYPEEHPQRREEKQEQSSEHDLHDLHEAGDDLRKRARRVAALQCQTKAELYEYAKQRGIDHRSQMSKAELVAALEG